jgi:aspartate/glutamate racemase
MKTIGMTGGMSWESSTEYSRIINEAVTQPLYDITRIHALAAVQFALQD